MQFDIDQVIQQTIDLGRTEALFISNYSEYIQIMASLNQNSSSGDTSKIDEIGKNLDKCIGFLSASSALGASVGAMMVVYSCRVVASLGADSDAIANIVIGSVYLATLGSEVILSGIDFHKSYKNYKNMKKNSTIENKYSSFKSTIVNNFKNLEKDIKTLNDSHAQYDAKVKAGQNVHKLSLETRILTKSLLETYISENKDEIENVVGKDKFDEIHNTLYQDVDTSKDDEDSLSKLQIASYALLGISFPLLILTSVAYCVPAFNRLSFDKAYEAGIAEQDQFAA
ncbi:MAG: hypothetical protein K2L48_03055 [Mycoplasmoidaceae bacterium]|nr:hypothetical protein [Mycoplasmoidaceae bacterium]